MAWTVPDSDLVVYRGMPLDVNYNNSLYFASAAARDAWFAAPTSPASIIGTFADYTYIRNNSVIIEGSIGTYYNANYMRFRNTAYNTRWFYAFVTAVDYVNDHAVRLTYELDLLQTWIHDVTLLPSYIDRMHVADDTRYSSLTDEGLELGEYELIEEPVAPFSQASTGTYAIMGVSRYITSTTEANKFAIRTSYAYNLPSMITYYIIRSSSELQGIYNFYRAYGNTDDILFVVPMPGSLISDQSNYSVDAAGHWYLDDAAAIQRVYSRVAPFTTLGRDAYTPHNNKLYNAPFCNITLTDHEGNSTTYQPQLFDWTASDTSEDPSLTAGYAHFVNLMPICEIPQIISAPMWYRSVREISWEDMTVCSSYAQQPVVTDSFAAFMALNSAQMANQYNILCSTRDYVRASGAYATGTAALAARQAYLATVQGKVEYGLDAAQTAGILTVNPEATPAQNALVNLATWGMGLGLDYSPAASATDKAGGGGAPSASGGGGRNHPGIPSGQIYYPDTGDYANHVSRHFVGEHIADNANQAAGTASINAGAILGTARQLEMDLTKEGQAAAMAQRQEGAAAMQEAYNNSQAELAIQGLAAKIQDARQISPSVRGTNSPNTIMALDLKGPTYCKYSLTAKYARMIDQFFDLYGYAIREVQTPSMHNRARWTYVKTVHCQLRGEVDATTRQQIINIFDNGITWWVTPSEIGRYDLANPTL